MVRVRLCAERRIKPDDKDDAPKGYGKHGGGDRQADESTDNEFNGRAHGQLEWVFKVGKRVNFKLKSLELEKGEKLLKLSEGAGFMNEFGRL